MKNNWKYLINQSIPNEFSSTLIKYKVEHNQNIHYNYNLAEITAMREERIRENKENKKRQKIADCLKNCKQNIAKHNQENYGGDMWTFRLKGQNYPWDTPGLPCVSNG